MRVRPPKYQLKPLSVDEMVTIVAALTGACDDKNVPTGVRKKAKLVHAKIIKQVNTIVDRWS